MTRVIHADRRAVVLNLSITNTCVSNIGLVKEKLVVIYRRYM